MWRFTNPLSMQKRTVRSSTACSSVPRVALVTSLLALGTFATVSSANSTPPPRPIPPADHVVPAWYLGMPVMMRSFEISAQPIMVEELIPDVAYPQVVAYIVGVVDQAIGASPDQRIALPDGGSVAMPGHQGVIACLSRPEAPVLGVAYAVVPGPSASSHNLKTDPMPARSVIGAPLATHILIGPSWLPLTSHATIEYGLYKGILRLRFFGANPVSWATPDWDNNYAYMPEMVRPCSDQRRAERKFMATQSLAPIPVH